MSTLAQGFELDGLGAELAHAAVQRVLHRQPHQHAVLFPRLEEERARPGVLLADAAATESTGTFSGASAHPAAHESAAAR